MAVPSGFYVKAWGAAVRRVAVPQTADTGEKLDPADVVFGEAELSQPAVIAVVGRAFGGGVKCGFDLQIGTILARRFRFWAVWEDDVEFSRLVQTLISAMQLERGSGLNVQSLRTILAVTGGITSRVFTMIKALAIEAIETGEERITDEAVQAWQPVCAKQSWNIRRQPLPAFQ